MEAKEMTTPEKWTFDAPWEAVFLDGLSGKWLRLSLNGHAVASYEAATWGGEQACIEAAWRYAYAPIADFDLTTAQAQLSEVCGKLHDTMCLPDDASVAVARKWAGEAREILKQIMRGE